jgi:hypothetical protein
VLVVEFDSLRSRAVWLSLSALCWRRALGRRHNVFVTGAVIDVDGGFGLGLTDPG